MSAFERLPPELVQQLLLAIDDGRYADAGALCATNADTRALCSDTRPDWLARYPGARPLLAAQQGAIGQRPSLLDVLSAVRANEALTMARRCALYALYASFLHSTGGSPVSLRDADFEDIEAAIASGSMSAAGARNVPIGTFTVPSDAPIHAAAIPIDGLFARILPARLERRPGRLVEEAPPPNTTVWKNRVSIPGIDPSGVVLYRQDISRAYGADDGSTTMADVRRAINSSLSQALVRAVNDTDTAAETPAACASIDLFAAYPNTGVFVLIPRGSGGPNSVVGVGVVPQP